MTASIVGMHSPLGPIAVGLDKDAVAGVRIGRRAAAESPHPLAREAIAQLTAYFAGKLRRFDLPLAPAASEEAEAFRAVMRAIPYGETRTYGALATEAGSVPRAIGQACRLNRLPIIVPCHRVTSAAGPEHYSADGGVATKRWLLAHERRVAGPPPGYLL